MIGKGSFQIKGDMPQPRCVWLRKTFRVLEHPNMLDTVQLKTCLTQWRAAVRQAALTLGSHLPDRLTALPARLSTSLSCASLDCAGQALPGLARPGTLAGVGCRLDGKDCTSLC